MRRDLVLERLEKLAEKFLKRAEEAESVKVAKASLDVFEATLRVADRLSLSAADEDTVLFSFLAQVHKIYRRSDLFRAYVAYCSQFSTDPLPKGDFFRRLVALGFKIQERNDQFIVFPPKVRSQYLMIEDTSTFPVAELPEPRTLKRGGHVKNPIPN